MDFSQLLRGNSLTFLYTVNSNRLSIKTYTLINTRANGYAFINTEFAATTTWFLDTKLQQLLTLCNIQGFNSKLAQLIINYIKLLMIIKGRQLKVFILVIWLRG